MPARAVCLLPKQGSAADLVDFTTSNQPLEPHVEAKKGGTANLVSRPPTAFDRSSTCSQATIISKTMTSSTVQEISLSRFVVDLLVLLSCAIPLLIFQLWVTPHKSGFYCNDDSIRYPFRDSTVSSFQLIIFGCTLPILIIVLFETMRVALWESRRNRAGTHQPEIYRFRGYTLHRMVVRLYIFVGYFALGACFNTLLTNIAKYSIGRLRPHFMDVCRPKAIWDQDCASNRSFQYIEDYECTGTNAFRINEARLAFYSGHSSFSFFAAFYTVLYLQARCYRPLHSRIVLPALQFLLLSLAMYCAYTRVSDYKHHWSDVLFGSLMGTLVAAFVGIYVAELFQRREIPSENDGLATDTAGTLVKGDRNESVDQDPPDKIAVEL
jgi:phosphatidate phosphatase